MALVQCPKCAGKGGLGTFGPCGQGDIHFKSACFVCGGRGQTDRTQACQKCAGKGGEGAFGPCEKNDIHFKRDCPMCQGQAYTNPVVNVVVGGGFGGFGGMVVQQQVAQLPVCPKCNGKGGLGAFGPCERSDVHFKSVCYVCNGACRTDRTNACPTCQGKGGSGAFGPCEKSDVHFRKDCQACNGQGYTAPVQVQVQVQQQGWGQPQQQQMGFQQQQMGFQQQQMPQMQMQMQPQMQMQGFPQPDMGMGMAFGMANMGMGMAQQAAFGMAAAMQPVGTITSAQYHNRDVTAQVTQEAFANGGVLRFNRDFNSMFGDPAPGVPKQLVINFMSRNGAMNTQSFSEGNWNQVAINLNA